MSIWTRREANLKSGQGEENDANATMTCIYNPLGLDPKLKTSGPASNTDGICRYLAGNM